ncbi:hypothetical protein AVEN_274929-1 [Araneus ventricosus]|uniref:Uncharacterized protein n=1 Tax=Araneus ventricosus TaxID=182803 RepID=A0A4Y2MNK3_ARAVE|nr:hypothetical protein AVEN_274929-1 [Araneus ventricosus]
MSPTQFHSGNRTSLGARWSSDKIPASGKRDPGSNPNFTEGSPRIWAQYMLNLTSWMKRTPAGVDGSLKREMPAQVSPLSPDHGSKLRGPP